MSIFETLSASNILILFLTFFFSPLLLGEINVNKREIKLLIWENSSAVLEQKKKKKTKTKQNGANAGLRVDLSMT